MNRKQKQTHNERIKNKATNKQANRREENNNNRGPGGQRRCCKDRKDICDMKRILYRKVRAIVTQALLVSGWQEGVLGGYVTT
jgi:hypothetical protein